MWNVNNREISQEYIEYFYFLVGHGQSIKSSPPDWGFAMWLTASHFIKIFTQNHHTGPWSWIDNFAQLWERKMNMKFGLGKLRVCIGQKF